MTKMIGTALLMLLTTAANADVKSDATPLERHARTWGLPSDHFKTGFPEPPPLDLAHTLLVFLIVGAGLGLAYFLLTKFAGASLPRKD